MENVMKMAGHFASHGLWSVSDGETLMPIVGHLDADDGHSMRRLVMGSTEAMAAGEQALNELEDGMKGVAFIKDAVVTLETGKTDCLVVDIRFADEPAKKVQMMLPYRNAAHEKGFAVHRLKLLQFDGIDQADLQSLMDAFMAGLEEHSQGGRIWREQYEDEAGESAGFYGEENTEFTAEEFSALKRAPFLLFMVVAAADGSVDRKEVKEFAGVMTDSENLGHPLLIRIATNVVTQVPEYLAALVNEKVDYIGELTRIGQIAEERLPDTDAAEFKHALLGLGQKIAEASGGFLGFGSKVSKKEKVALGAIALCLDLKAAH